MCGTENAEVDGHEGGECVWGTGVTVMQSTVVGCGCDAGFDDVEVNGQEGGMWVSRSTTSR